MKKFFAIGFIGLLCSSCAASPEENYLYKNAEFASIDGTYYRVAKDSIQNQKENTTFIFDDGKQFKQIALNCKTGNALAKYIWQSGKWQKNNSTTKTILDSRIKRFVCKN
jgi:hypothetical protein